MGSNQGFRGVNSDFIWAIFNLYREMLSLVIKKHTRGLMTINSCQVSSSSASPLNAFFNQTDNNQSNAIHLFKTIHGSAEASHETSASSCSLGSKINREAGLKKKHKGKLKSKHETEEESSIPLKKSLLKRSGFIQYQQMQEFWNEASEADKKLMKPIFFLRVHDGKTDLHCQSIGALVHARTPGKRAVFQSMTKGTVDGITYVADPIEVGKHLVKMRLNSAEKEIIEPFVIKLKQRLNRLRSEQLLSWRNGEEENEKRVQAIKDCESIIGVLSIKKDRSLLPFMSNTLSRTREKATRCREALKNMRLLGEKNPATTNELLAAFQLFMDIETSGPLTDKNFWRVGQPKKKSDYYEKDVQVDPYLIEITPQPNDEWLIFGDITSSEELKKELSKYVEDDFRLKNMRHKVVITGDFNHGDKDSPQIMYLLMRLKIANPDQVIILQDKDDPYRNLVDDFSEQMIIELSKDERIDTNMLSGLKVFYKMLPRGLVVNLPNERKLLISNDDIKLRCNFFASQQTHFAPFEYLEVDHESLQSIPYDFEVGQTMKFHYRKPSEVIRFDDQGELVQGDEETVRPYVNPVEVQTIAKKHDVEFEYVPNEKHIYITSDKFLAKNERITIQYLNSFLAEMNHLSQTQKEEYPEISAILENPETAPGDLRKLYALAPHDLTHVTESYKIHLMPEQKHLIPTIEHLCRMMPIMDEKARKSMAGIKILTWDKHLKVQEEKSSKKEPTPPTIVIYLVAKSPEDAQSTLDAIFNDFEKAPHLKHGAGVTPRFNSKCTSLIYVAQGTGPDKEIKPELREEVKTLKAQLVKIEDPIIKKMQMRQIKMKELEMQTPTLFQDDMAFFSEDLNHRKVDYRLHYPGLPQKKLAGDIVDNGTKVFKNRLNNRSSLAIQG